jgi:predicted GTPase
MDDTTLISSLQESYKRQISLYQSLASLVQKTLSQIILTRGDVSGLMGNFAQKKDLLDSILKERAETEPLVAMWQKRKADVPLNAQTVQLDSLLQKTQSVIQEFLEGEEQLKKCLEHVVKKGNAAP